MLLISDVGLQVELSQKRIREYEKAGLIKPSRAENTNNRLYTDSDIAQIRRIKQLIHEHGFTVNCLKVFLTMAPCWKIFQCGDTECSCYLNSKVTCYELKRNTEGGDSDKCEKCAIYLNRHMKKMQIFEKTDSP